MPLTLSLLRESRDLFVEPNLGSARHKQEGEMSPETPVCLRFVTSGAPPLALAPRFL